MKQIHLDAKVENLDKVLAFIEGTLEAAECPVKLVIQTAIAAEEVFVNIAQYAYGGNCGPCSVGAEIKDGTLIIQFDDKGLQYDPLEKMDPDTNLGAEDRNIGGLGIFMVKKFMDSVEYRREDGINRLTLCKAIH